MQSNLGIVTILWLFGTAPLTAADEVATLPAGVNIAWDMAQAYRETTATRERICLNGLWRWQPATPDSGQVPNENWGYFKVPGSWPGITNYMQKDTQTVHAHPSWKSERMGSVSAAWYERTLSVPRE